MENNNDIVELIIGLVAGGGLSGLITALVMSRKTKHDIGTSNIEVAMKLRDEAIEQYNTAEEKLEMARKLLKDVSEELDSAKKYIETLQGILCANGICYPPFKPETNAKCDKQESEV